MMLSNLHFVSLFVHQIYPNCQTFCFSARCSKSTAIVSDFVGSLPRKRAHSDSSRQLSSYVKAILHPHAAHDKAKDSFYISHPTESALAARSTLIKQCTLTLLNTLRYTIKPARFHSFLALYS